jgi:hypothetical protein
VHAQRIYQDAGVTHQLTHQQSKANKTAASMHQGAGKQPANNNTQPVGMIHKPT